MMKYRAVFGVLFGISMSVGASDLAADTGKAAVTVKETPADAPDADTLIIQEVPVFQPVRHWRFGLELGAPIFNGRPNVYAGMLDRGFTLGVEFNLAYRLAMFESEAFVDLNATKTRKPENNAGYPWWRRVEMNASYLPVGIREHFYVAIAPRFDLDFSGGFGYAWARLKLEDDWQDYYNYSSPYSDIDHTLESAQSPFYQVGVGLVFKYVAHADIRFGYRYTKFTRDGFPMHNTNDIYLGMSFVW